MTMVGQALNSELLAALDKKEDGRHELEASLLAKDQQLRQLGALQRVRLLLCCMRLTAQREQRSFLCCRVSFSSRLYRCDVCLYSMLSASGFRACCLSDVSRSGALQEEQDRTTQVMAALQAEKDAMADERSRLASMLSQTQARAPMPVCTGHVLQRPPDCMRPTCGVCAC